MKTRKNLNNFLLMLVFLLATLCTAAAGETLYVNTDGSDDAFTSIQAAIDAAANGDEIEVAPGTYNENINFNGKAVRLYSHDGAADTTIDGCGADIVVRCDSDEGADTILEGFTITGGNGVAYGGGMFNFVNYSPTVTNCIFTGNSAGTAEVQPARDSQLGYRRNVAGAVSQTRDCHISQNISEISPMPKKTSLPKARSLNCKEDLSNLR